MRRIITYILPIVALTLSACSNSDSDGPAITTSRVIMLNSGSGIAAWQAQEGTRAAVLDAPETDVINSIGVFASDNAESGFVFDNQLCYNAQAPLNATNPTVKALMTDWTEGNFWPYSPIKYWMPGANYNFVGYAPYSAGNVSAQTADGEITEFTWSGLSSISTSDLVLSNCIGYKALNSTNPALPLSLKHLMARLRFCFKLSGNYEDLRTIVVKQMKVDYADARSMSLIVSFNKDDDEYSSTYRWERQDPGTGTTSMTLPNEPGVKSITLAKGVDYQALASLYYEVGDPLNIFNIEVTYDVYDNEGTLLRANDSAVSAITMLRTVEAGKYYDVKIRIEPSYLYILSDQEPDTDGELIIP